MEPNARHAEYTWKQELLYDYTDAVHYTDAASPPTDATRSVAPQMTVEMLSANNG
jgi:hypothetical protein